MRVTAKRLTRDDAPDEAPAVLPLQKDGTPSHMRVEIDCQLQPNGLFTEITKAAIHLLTEAGVGKHKIQRLLFNRAVQRLTILECFIRKFDGSVHHIAAKDGPVPGDQVAAMFCDERTKILAFPDAEPGDIICWTTRRECKQPFFRNHFATAHVFGDAADARDIRLTIDAPKSFALKTETHGLKWDVKRTRGREIHTWSYSKTHAAAGPPSVLSPLDVKPRCFVSTFQDYDALARAYRRVIEHRIVAIPDVKALAEEITAGCKTRREEAEQLYYWISNNIKFIPLPVGIGGPEPHSPFTVIANGYGDSKDHSILFASLLKARGIACEIALTNSGNSYALASVPTLAQLNHALVWLPEFSLYADTTAMLPFSCLKLEAYGKPVLHAVSSGQALRQIPVRTSHTAVTSSKTYAWLLDDGGFAGTSIMSGTGPLSTPLRKIARNVPTSGNGRSLSLHFPNDPASYIVDCPKLDMLQERCTLVGHFRAPATHPKLPDGGVAMPSPMPVLPRPADQLLGPLWLESLPDDEPAPWFTGIQTEAIDLELPPDRTLERLPADKTIESTHFRYSVQWSYRNHVVSVRRHFAITAETSLSEGEDRIKAADALRRIRDDYRETLTLVPVADLEKPLPVWPVASIEFTPARADLQAES